MPEINATNAFSGGFQVVICLFAGQNLVWFRCLLEGWSEEMRVSMEALWLSTDLGWVLGLPPHPCTVGVYEGTAVLFSAEPWIPPLLQSWRWLQWQELIVLQSLFSFHLFLLLSLTTLDFSAGKKQTSLSISVVFFKGTERRSKATLYIQQKMWQEEVQGYLKLTRESFSGTWGKILKRKQKTSCIHVSQCWWPLCHVWLKLHWRKINLQSAYSLQVLQDALLND